MINHPGIVRQNAITILSSLISTFNKYTVQCRDADSAITEDLIQKVASLSRNMPDDAFLAPKSASQTISAARSTTVEDIVNYELPRFEYNTRCQLIGSISVEELKLWLKNLLLSLHHIQMKDLVLNRANNNGGDQLEKKESQLEETICIIMSSVALMAFDEMIVNQKWVVI